MIPLALRHNAEGCFVVVVDKILHLRSRIQTPKRTVLLRLWDLNVSKPYPFIVSKLEEYLAHPVLNQLILEPLVSYELRHTGNRSSVVDIRVSVFPKQRTNLRRKIVVLTLEQRQVRCSKLGYGVEVGLPSSLQLFKVIPYKLLGFLSLQCVRRWPVCANLSTCALGFFDLSIGQLSSVGQLTRNIIDSSLEHSWRDTFNAVVRVIKDSVASSYIDPKVILEGNG